MTRGGPEPPDGVEVFVNPDDFDVPVHDLERAIRHVLEHAEVRTGELSLTLLSDDEIRTMNRDYLGRDRPTDVIAFSLGEQGSLLGDVYVGVSQAMRNAEDHGVPFEEELMRLSIHGALHVLGHDHPEGPDRSESPMFRLQELLLRELLEKP